VQGRLLATAWLLAAAPPARAQDVQELLAKGPIVQVQEDGAGRFAAAVAVIEVAVAPERAWEIVTDFGRYKEFLPRVVKSEVVRSQGDERDVAVELEAPVVNTRYTVRYKLDRSNLRAEGRWIEGSLEGSSWLWQISARPGGGALLHYTLRAKGFSAVVEALEDKQQTATIGINVAAAIATVKAMKRRAEGK
jgi:ribosome-associated toxin RatA of RatAB toxin-antitoxin module